MLLCAILQTTRNTAMLNTHPRFAPLLRLGLACLLLTTMAHADTGSIAAERFQQLDQALQAEVGQGRRAGIDVLIEENGKLLHRSRHGYQDIEGQVPLADDSLYKIFSLTKPVTSVAMLMLQEDRKSTRLNSSHVRISYAVFCLKKKKTTTSTAMRLKTTVAPSAKENAAPVLRQKVR